MAPMMRNLPILLLLGLPVVGQATPAREIPDQEARKLVRETAKQLHGKKAKLRDRLKAVELLGRHSNVHLVQPLLKIVKTDKAKTIRQAAVKALGEQPSRRARPALMHLIEQANIRKEPSFSAALVRAVGKNSYIQKDWREFRKMFEKTIDVPNAAAMHLAILEVAGQHREVEAVDYLMRHIDEPIPVNVDSASNPPASYWEARYKNWQKWRPQVIESLFKITGQRFGNAKEAKIWWIANAKSLTREVKKEKSARKPKSKKKKEP